MCCRRRRCCLRWFVLVHDALRRIGYASIFEIGTVWLFVIANTKQYIIHDGQGCVYDLLSYHILLA